MNLPNSLQNIITTLEQHNAKAIVIGGAVRDFLLDLSVKDYDIEVYNINTLDKLEALLKTFGTVNQVGKSFGVLKLQVDNLEYDFSLPRVEKKVDKGHKGFSVKVNSNLNYKEAFKRRDFTINAIGYDYLEKKFIDPFDGIADIKSKILRHIDSSTFIPNYALEITYLLQIICPWAFTKKHRLTYGLNSIFLQTPKSKAFVKSKVILMHNLGL